MSVHSTEPAPAAYSYVRFSSPQQAEGDSLRRQTEATEAWCERNGIALDTSLSLRDLGVSAFKGRHRDDKFALGHFLKLAERGRIPKGSYLVIENLDRLSREDERKALRLWMDLLDAGVNVVQLSPETIFRHEKSDMVDVMRAIIELSRGHSESRVKSERIGAAWADKKRRAREEGETLTHKLPGWIEERNGKRCIKPGAKEAIQRIIQLTTRGYGERRAARLLNQEGVSCFGRGGTWKESYIRKLLRDRRLLGEFQPRIKETGEPDGEPIPNYFPAVLTEAEFYAALRGRAGRKSTRKGTTPVELDVIRDLHEEGKAVLEIARKLGITRNQVYRALTTLKLREKPAGKPQGVYLFATMVKSLRGQTYMLETWLSGGRRYKVFMLKGDGYATFPYAVFERALLHELRELDPREVLEGANGHDNVIALEGELGTVEARIAELEGELLSGDVKAIVRVIRQLEARQAELSRQLADARQRAVNPLSATWGEAKTLLAVMDSAADPEDVRIRLRGALRRIIASIKMTVLEGKPGRIALVDVEFAGQHEGRSRTLTIWYRPQTGNQHKQYPGAWAVVSAAGQGKPIEYAPSDEPGEPPIPTAADWAQCLPVEPETWFPLPE